MHCIDNRKRSKPVPFLNPQHPFDPTSSRVLFCANSQECEHAIRPPPIQGWCTESREETPPRTALCRRECYPEIREVKSIMWCDRCQSFVSSGDCISMSAYKQQSPDWTTAIHHHIIWYSESVRFISFQSPRDISEALPQRFFFLSGLSCLRWTRSARNERSQPLSVKSEAVLNTRHTTPYIKT